jgi:hypothetical protein
VFNRIASLDSKINEAVASEIRDEHPPRYQNECVVWSPML